MSFKKVKAYYIDLVKGKRKGALSALFSFLLFLTSFIYGFLVKLILFGYQTGLLKSFKPDCRVISVGNITWGGTGKTPLVEALVGFLKRKGRNPAILIRGYGEDEVYVLKDKFKDIPVLPGKDRVKTARNAKEHFGVDTIILDDGFQHWRLRRDLDVVLVNANCPFGNRRLIPRGVLREPLSSLSRADALVLTKINQTAKSQKSIKEELRKYNPQAPIYEAAHITSGLRRLSSGEEIELSAISGNKVALLCGIEDPRSFARTLDSLGLEISLRFYFPDHYKYTEEDLGKIEKKCQQKQVKFIVTTEKDAAKLIPVLKIGISGVEILSLGIKFKITRDEDKFFSQVVGEKDTQRVYSILILSDGRSGHLNQTKAIVKLIEEIKLKEGLTDNKIKTKVAEVKFKNAFCRNLLAFCSIFSSSRCRWCLRCLRFCLENNSFKELADFPCNVIVSAGSSLSPVNLFLSYKNKARNVILMKPPFLNLNRFDLAVIPKHDRIKPRDNVLITRIAPNPVDPQYLREKANVLKKRLQKEDYKEELDGPTIGVLIGGDTAKFRLTSELMDKIISQLKNAADNLNGQILLTTSRRTPSTVEKLLKDKLACFPRCKLLIIANEKNIPEAVGGILGLSDVVLVSGESISMVSEAINAGRFVLSFIPEKKYWFSTKQERFLGELQKEGILKIVQPDNLFSEMKRARKEKPLEKEIKDRGLIRQALSRILRD